MHFSAPAIECPRRPEKRDRAQKLIENGLCQHQIAPSFVDKRGGDDSSTVEWEIYVLLSGGKEGEGGRGRQSFEGRRRILLEGYAVILLFPLCLYYQNRASRAGNPYPL